MWQGKYDKKNYSLLCICMFESPKGVYQTHQFVSRSTRILCMPYNSIKVRINKKTNMSSMYCKETASSFDVTMWFCRQGSYKYKPGTTAVLTKDVIRFDVVDTEVREEAMETSWVNYTLASQDYRYITIFFMIPACEKHYFKWICQRLCL